MRAVANAARQMFNAYVDAGFSEAHALRLVEAWVTAGFNQGGGSSAES